MLMTGISKSTDVWQELKSSKLPVFVYGMGNGAAKILDVMDKKGIAAAGFFASDEFVRGHSFRGHLVHKLSEIEVSVPEFNIVCAFGTNRPEVLSRISEISKRHKLFAPDVPVCGENLFDREFYEENAEEIALAQKLFSDEKSKRLYKNIINFKLSGDPAYLESDSDCLADIFKEAVSDTENPIYADLGAYDGDTVRLFAEHFNYEKIYAFEPHPKNFRKLCEKTVNLENIEAINAAAWESETQIAFSNTDNRNNNAFSSGNGFVNAVRADDFIGEADIIKLDVEGAEEAALRGLSQNIKRGATLICAVYHRSEDIFKIPLKLQKRNPNYTFSLRKVPYIPAWDVFLIARKEII
jgi:FkbM family methyltransferase